MRIEDYASNPYISSVFGIEQKSTSSKDGQSIPSMGDSVSISEEGLSLYRQLQNENSSENSNDSMKEELKKEELKKSLFAMQTNKSAENSSSNEETDESEALKEEFTKYLYTTDGRSRDPSSASADPAKQIEALEKQIKTLQGQLVKIQETTLGDGNKEGESNSIKQQIESLTTQIAELKSFSTEDEGSDA